MDIQELNTLCVVERRDVFDSASDDSTSESGDDQEHIKPHPCYDASVVGVVTFDTLHWLFEAQDNCVIAKLLGSSNIEIFEYECNQVSPFDCFVLGYCVSQQLYLED